MTAGEAPEFDRRWHELRNRFVERLVVRMQAIRGAWAVLRSGSDPRGEARKVLFHQVHSLSGSGATFGFTGLSDAARALEPLVDPDKTGAGEAWGAERAAAIDRMVAAIEAEAQLINPEA